MGGKGMWLASMGPRSDCVKDGSWLAGNCARKALSVAARRHTGIRQHWRCQSVGRAQAEGVRLQSGRREGQWLWQAGLKWARVSRRAGKKSRQGEGVDRLTAQRELSANERKGGGKEGWGEAPSRQLADSEEY